MLLLNPYQFAAPGGSDSAELTALLAAMTTQPDATRKGIIATMLDGLVADGVMSKLDLLYVLIAHEEQASRVNWASPGNYTLSKVNNPVFTVDGGWTDGGSASNYMDSTFNVASASGRKIAQNDAGFGVGILNSASSSVSVAGAGATDMFLRPYTGSAATSRLFGASTNTWSGPTTSKGITAVDRTGATALQGFKAASSLGTAATASAAPASSTFKLLWLSGSTSTGQTVSLAWCGQALGPTLQAALRSRFLAYCSSIGVSPE